MKSSNRLSTISVDCRSNQQTKPNQYLAIFMDLPNGISATYLKSREDKASF